MRWTNAVAGCVSDSKNNWTVNAREDAVNRSAHLSGFRLFVPQLAVCVLIFTGCVAPKVVDYKPFHKKSFASRKQDAELLERSTSEVLASGYLLLGYIDLRQNIRTCYVDGT